MKFDKKPSGRRGAKLLAIEILTIGYSIITALITLVFWQKLNNPVHFLLTRVAVVCGFWFIYHATRLIKNEKTSTLVRILFPMALLSHWYSETYEFNRIFPNLDHIFANAEQWLFGFQPAVAFAQFFGSKWISEIFYMGYFFYFPMMMLIIIYCYFAKRAQFNKLSFIYLGSFFLYYLLFIFIPVAGPQYYFPVIGAENVVRGIFPSVSDYFFHHIELLPGPGFSEGLFYKMVKMSQDMGERPTAAFPSSHVGISTILMIWLFFNNKKILFALLPFYISLCCATVYIQAHYLIDVISGWISAFAFYFMLAYSYEKMRVRLKVSSTPKRNRYLEIV